MLAIPMSNHITILSFTKTMAIGTVALLALVMWPHPLRGAAVPVRFIEGVAHAFLMLRTVEGDLLAQGEVLQIDRGGEVDSRMVFRFKDGSTFDETAVFTQQRVFTLQRYWLIQRGPVFVEDTEIYLERSGKYRVKTRARKDGREGVLEGALDMPPDIYNGMVLTVAKNLPKGGTETIHIVAFTPAPRLIQLKMMPAGEHQVRVGELTKTATHYILKPQLGIWLKLFAKLLGHLPPDYHAWIIPDEVPTFVRFEGPLYATGPVWRVELAIPRWPD